MDNLIKNLPIVLNSSPHQTILVSRWSPPEGKVLKLNFDGNLIGKPAHLVLEAQYLMQRGRVLWHSQVRWA